MFEIRHFGKGNKELPGCSFKLEAQRSSPRSRARARSQACVEAKMARRVNGNSWQNKVGIDAAGLIEGAIVCAQVTVLTGGTCVGTAT